jgi:hypothetical protein
MVWAAGGPAKDAGRVLEFKPAGTDAAPIRVDLETLLHATADALNPRARAGDVVSVSPAGSVHVDGWVDKPGSYPVTRGLTLSGAIAAAGGPLFPADRRHADVKRVVAPGEERSFTIDLEAIAAGTAPDLAVADGDVVRLPATAPRLVSYGFWTLARGSSTWAAASPLLGDGRDRTHASRRLLRPPRPCTSTPSSARCRRITCATASGSSTSTAGSPRPAWRSRSA